MKKFVVERNLPGAGNLSAEELQAIAQTWCDVIVRLEDRFRTDYANLEASGRAELARNGWKVDYLAVRHGLGLRIPHPEGFDHPNLLIVLGAATLGGTRLIDNVDVVRKDGED